MDRRRGSRLSNSGRRELLTNSHLSLTQVATCVRYTWLAEAALRQIECRTGLTLRSYSAFCLGPWLQERRHESKVLADMCLLLVMSR